MWAVGLKDGGCFGSGWKEWTAVLMCRIKDCLVECNLSVDVIHRACSRLESVESCLKSRSSFEKDSR